MHDVIEFLKPVVSRNAPTAVAGSYVFRDGQVWAARPGLTAGMPVPSLLPIDANVPAEELEAVIARMSSAPELSLGDGALWLRAGRLKVDIRVAYDEPPAAPDMDGTDFAPCPPDLPAWLALASEHLGDRGWTSGVRLATGRVTAIRDVSGIDLDAPGLSLAEPLLLPEEAAAVLAKLGAPAEVAALDGALLCRWADGRWLRAQGLSAEMPTRVDAIFDAATEADRVAVTDEWREAFDDARALSDGFVDLRAAGFASGRGAGRVDVAFATGLPEAHASRWSTRTLGPVLACAAAWCPGGYPAPCRFDGPSFRGVVIGVKR